MSFKQHTLMKGAVLPFEYLPATASESFAIGEALVLSSGTLTKCGATATPEFICQSQLTTAKAGDELAVTRVSELQELETTLSVAGTSLKIGDKVTLHTDGEQVTATTTGGVFQLSAIVDSAKGGVVRGYFRRGVTAASGGNG